MYSLTLENNRMVRKGKGKKAVLASDENSNINVKTNELELTPKSKGSKQHKINVVSPCGKLDLGDEQEESVCAKLEVKEKEVLTSIEQSVSVVTPTTPSTPRKISRQINTHPKVDKIYGIVRKSSGALGGNGYDGAIYGELTQRSMQKVLEFLVGKCQLNSQSRFIDVGSGLGKPNFHASQYPGCRLSLGIELEDIRWQLAMHNLLHVLPEVHDETESTLSSSSTKLHGGCNFMVNDIDNASSMDPFTHIYMFDLGFPPPLQQSIARKFNESYYSQYLISYRPPHRVIDEYGYKVDFLDQMLTSMHGSGEGHTAYFYKRNNTPPLLKSAPATLTRVKIPARICKIGEGATTNNKSQPKLKTKIKNEKGPEDASEEVDIEVICDPAFLAGVQLAVGKLTDLREYVNQVTQAHLTSGRPKRERKPAVKNDFIRFA